MIEISICLFRLTEQDLFTHLWTWPRVADCTATVRVEEWHKGQDTQSSWCPLLTSMALRKGKQGFAKDSIQAKESGVVSFSLAPNFLLFHIISEYEKKQVA